MIYTVGWGHGAILVPGGVGFRYYFNFLLTGLK
jgi:hypothetical protein